MQIMGLVAATHDSGLALIEDGRPTIVLEEERLYREKRTKAFPRHCLLEAFGSGARGLADVDLITTPWDEKKLRANAIQQAFKTAATVPLGVARDALKIMDLASRAIARGNRNAVSDGAVAVLACRTAGLGAAYNVKINLTGIKDPDFVEEMTRQIEELEHRVIEKETAVLAQIRI